jgi:hypothetical protein
MCYQDWDFRHFRKERLAFKKTQARLFEGHLARNIGFSSSKVWFLRASSESAQRRLLRGSFSESVLTQRKYQRCSVDPKRPDR